MAVVQQTLQIAALDDLAGEFVVVAVRLVVLGVQMEINAWVAGVSVVVTTIVALGDSGVDVIVTLADLCVDEAVALDDDLPGDDHAWPPGLCCAALEGDDRAASSTRAPAPCRWRISRRACESCRRRCELLRALLRLAPTTTAGAHRRVPVRHTRKAV